MKALLMLAMGLFLVRGISAQEMDLSTWPSTEPVPFATPALERWISAPADSLILKNVHTPAGWSTVVRGDSAWIAKPGEGGEWWAWSLGEYLNGPGSGCFCEYTWEHLPQGRLDLWSWTYCEAFSHTNAFEQLASKHLIRHYWLLGEKPVLLLSADETTVLSNSWVNEDTDQIERYEESMVVWNEIGPGTWNSYSIYSTNDTIRYIFDVSRHREANGWSAGLASTSVWDYKPNYWPNEFPPHTQPFCNWWFEAEVWLPKD